MNCPKAATRQFVVDRFPIKAHSIALTLTFRHLPGSAEIQSMAASGTLRHFQNVFYKLLLGSRWQFTRQPAQIWCVEQSTAIRMHAHGAITFHEPLSRTQLQSACRQAIKKTRNLLPEFDLQLPCDLGWLNYITKLNNTDDCLDWLASDL
jgi:hypothetical protein